MTNTELNVRVFLMGALACWVLLVVAPTQPDVTPVVVETGEAGSVAVYAPAEDEVSPVFDCLLAAGFHGTSDGFNRLVVPADAFAECAPWPVEV